MTHTPIGESNHNINCGACDLSGVHIKDELPDIVDMIHNINNIKADMSNQLEYIRTLIEEGNYNDAKYEIGVYQGLRMAINQFGYE